MTAEPRIFGNSAVIALNDETVGLVVPCWWLSRGPFPMASDTSCFIFIATFGRMYPRIFAGYQNGKQDHTKTP